MLDGAFRQAHRSTRLPMPPTTALPTFYWLVFGCYEPLLSVGGSIGALLYPEQVRSWFARFAPGLIRPSCH